MIVVIVLQQNRLSRVLSDILQVWPVFSDNVFKKEPAQVGGTLRRQERTPVTPKGRRGT